MDILMCRKVGYKLSEETKKKISDTLKRRGIKPPILKGKDAPGYIHCNCMRENYCQSCQKRISQHAKRWCRECFVLFYRKENHHHYKGGQSNLYPIEFSNKLKQEIRLRDNYTCQLCKIKEKNYCKKLAIHHIDYNKNNCKKDNLITLCNQCNIKVNYNREYWKQYFQNKLKSIMQIDFERFNVLAVGLILQNKIRRGLKVKMSPELENSSRRRYF
ncbi:MAG: HNH endonuclease [Fusobacteriaceae bacterium]|nr:HNH endonuclease [Fusobacteriaceae bacterium]